MTNQHGAFVWYELMTDAPDAASAFYETVVGWRIDARNPADDFDYRMIQAEHPVAGMLALDQAMLDAGVKPAWLGYLGADDVDKAAHAVANAGGAVRIPPRDIPGVGRFAFVTDDQKVAFYLMTGAGDAPSDSFSVDALKRCAWNELAAPDQHQALHFYGTLFGITKAGSMDMGPMGEYSFLQHGDVTVGALMTAQGPKPAGWTFYFRVPDVDAAVATVADAGGAVMHGPNDVPGGQRVLIASDPQGAVFGLVSGKPGMPA